MKKLLLLSITTFIIFSCDSSDDNDEGSENQNLYETVTLGTQTWAIENVDIETYSDGTPIPQVTDYNEWINLNTGAWCYMRNDSQKTKIYNWYAIAGIHDDDPNTPNKEFAPNGWRVPSVNDWEVLIEHVENGEYEGTTAEALSNDNWSQSGRHSTGTPGYRGVGNVDNNSTGFSAHAVGWRISTQTTTDGTGFVEDGFDVFYWTSNGYSENGSIHSRTAYFSYASRNVSINGRIATDGCSVRFIRIKSINNV